MRGAPDTMTFLRPRNARDAVDLYGAHPDALPIAGGTDVMVSWNAGFHNRKKILDLSPIKEWTGIKKTASGILIGSLATHTDILRDRLVRTHLPLLAEACATVGAVQIQNRGTIGGNIANASPAGDTFPSLAVYDAMVRTVSPSGGRDIPFLEVFAGVKRTSLRPSELIEAVHVPVPKRPRRRIFRKVGTRAAQAISKTVAAGLLWLTPKGTVKELRFALGSMSPTVRRLRSAEAFLTGKRPTPETVREACELLAKDVDPIDDFRSTKRYRLRVSRNILAALLAP